MKILSKIVSNLNLKLPSLPSFLLVAGEAQDHQDPDPRMMLVTLLVAWVHLRFRISQTCKRCMWMLTMFIVNGLFLCSGNIRCSHFQYSIVNAFSVNFTTLLNIAYMSGIPLQILMLIVGDLARCCIAPVSRHHSGCHVSVTYHRHQSRSHHRDIVTQNQGRLQTYFLLIRSWLCRYFVDIYSLHWHSPLGVFVSSPSSYKYEVKISNSKIFFCPQWERFQPGPGVWISLNFARVDWCDSQKR